MTLDPGTGSYNLLRRLPLAGSAPLASGAVLLLDGGVGGEVGRIVTMSAHTLSPEAAEQRARDLLEARMASVRDLVTKAAEAEERRHALGEAEAEVREAWRTALRGGWSAEELRSLGVAEPTTTARRRARRGKRQTTSPGETSSSESAQNSPEE